MKYKDIKIILLEVIGIYLTRLFYVFNIIYLSVVYAHCRKLFIFVKVGVLFRNFSASWITKDSVGN